MDYIKGGMYAQQQTLMVGDILVYQNGNSLI